MILRELTMHRYDWEKELTGKLVFANDSGEVSLKLSQQHCDRILAIVADGVVASAREVAENLTASIITAPRLEDKGESHEHH
jgi:preprotein translocase subunit SecD